MKLSNRICTIVLVFYSYFNAYAQKDSSLISFHSQATSISQYHPQFKAPYSGMNSMIPDEKIASSLTNTLFFAIRPWKSALIIVNPEVAGGVGLSGTTGLAGFPNGEIFRVGNPKPTIYLARLLFEERIPLHNSVEVYVADDPNIVRGHYYTDYLSFYGGRFCLADKFDANPYNHDPRGQFMNWSFMSAGAWDYAADTRGYTWGIGSEWKNKDWRAALAFTLEPSTANALDFDMNINKAFATQFEVTHFHTLKGGSGQLQATIFFNKAHMGNYREAINSNVLPPDITTTRDYNNHKWGWILNGSQQWNKNWAAFGRISWNDGKNETWAYTEIDRSVNIGIQYSKNNSDQSNVVGAGVVVNGLSTDHRNYLAAGGYGFILGDGKLNYGPEIISEIYYRFSFFNDHLQVSPDYQFAIHPAYNKDRGPIHIFSLRTHIEL